MKGSTDQGSMRRGIWGPSLTGHDVLAVQNVSELLVLAGGLVQSLLEQDSAGDVLAEAGCGHQQLTVCPSVVLSVLHTNAVQSLAAGGVGLVHGQETTALGGNCLLQDTIGQLGLNG